VILLLREYGGRCDRRRGQGKDKTIFDGSEDASNDEEYEGVAMPRPTDLSQAIDDGSHSGDDGED